MTEPGKALIDMRRTAPLVHCITNYVSMDVMANVLLAAGAAPAMIHAREEAAEFAAIASALVVNIGTLSPPWVEAMEAAATAAKSAGTPWVLDPVAAGATAYRRDVAARLIALQPDVVRGNASEVMALAGLAAAGKGVDSGDSVESAHDAARSLALATGGIVAVTGEVDFVTDGKNALEVTGGDPMMTRVTALGCALSGIVAAFAASAPSPADRLPAVAAALAFYGAAGQHAAAESSGPGSFAVAFLDALSAIDEKALGTGSAIRAA